MFSKDTLKNLTHAHTWLGLIISGALMIIFVCGSLSFYRAEIHQWDRFHNFHKALPTEQIPVSHVIDKLQGLGYDIRFNDRVSIDLPSENKPFYTVFFLATQDGKRQYVNYSFAADDGRLLDLDRNQFFLADMLYRMHYHLYIPKIGFELVGIITLIFFVVLLTGLLIHLKKIISHYYQYRIHKAKDKYLDGHILIGVTAFPYTFMYALTGVYFNLALIFQAGFGFAAFNGNFIELDKALGKPDEIQHTPSGLTLPMQQYDALLSHIKKRYPTHQLTYLFSYGMADKAAHVEVILRQPGSLHEYHRLRFALDDFTQLSGDIIKHNPALASAATFEALHYGTFGGDLMRFLMFLMGLACCYLILTGNLIWLEKRAKNRQQSKVGLRFVSAMTIALSSGILISVAMCFVVTRFLSEHFAMQNILVPVFHLSWLFTMLHAFVKNAPRKVMVQQLIMASLLFLFAPAYDLFNGMLAIQPLLLADKAIWWVNSTLTAMAILCLLIARHYNKGTTK
ncbi:PepSY-associated TM helix domain-containing protein [Pseudoalteromonas umbrosa]|uniref:PepSY-associated TM helix domain-containing protein n=1 Tax=Pseudoalteromonas umbrosa TaxID=3048489 RepID=UPI0024C3A180|nr:PepSY-associated TM helix domain-containing protein [Pseudoalteromonas sp. B95]MDK1288828.1 PepSY-associated TM helix domain-containing protein [Pseudoalteromonas sp. B95]